MYRRNKQLEKGEEVLRQALKARPNDKELQRLRDIYDESDPEQRVELLLAHAETQADPFRRAIEKANICLRNKRGRRWGLTPRGRQMYPAVSLGCCFSITLRIHL